MQQSLPEALPRVTRKPRSWLVILDYLFYTVLVVAVLAFIYYLYTYRDTIALDLPFLLQGAAVTIILSVISVVFAMILGFLGAIGRLSRFAPVRWLATTYVEVVRGT
ncbi:MAG TPA: ABC transporter permease subunit, partial [Ktedonobacteraceae bacterium]|nr:ABC transporter permease subunit [Ktedonobacteraceae bacterium]